MKYKIIYEWGGYSLYRKVWYGWSFVTSSDSKASLEHGVSMGFFDTVYL